MMPSRVDDCYVHFFDPYSSLTVLKDELTQGMPAVQAHLRFSVLQEGGCEEQQCPLSLNCHVYCGYYLSCCSLLFASASFSSPYSARDLTPILVYSYY